MTGNSLRYPLFVLLILTLLLPVAAIDAGQTGQYIIFEQAPSLSEKIDPAVKEDLDREDYVEVLVKMTRQVDTEQVARDTLKRSSVGQHKQLAVRTAVVDELQANAAMSQKDIRHYLEQEQSRGGVLEYRSFYIVNLVFVKASPAVVEQLARRADVKVILPNSSISAEPPEITGLTPLAAGWGISQINAPAVWERGFEGAGVVVGVIDSGVDWQHEALQTKWRGYNPEAPSSPDASYNWLDATSPKVPLPEDSGGHGTLVTGVIVGSVGSERIGVAPAASWIAARIFRDGEASSDVALAAGEFMLAPTDAAGENPRPDLAPDIINNSWGSTEPGDANEWFRQMVQAWRSAGILPVFAAGNDGPDAGTIACPANYPEALAVAATDSTNSLADFSSRGPGYIEGIKPELSAPGVSIRSSFPGGDYKFCNGTSMATPHISGAAALLLSADGNLSVDELEQIMLDTATPLTSLTYPLSPNYGFGYGLVDTLAAINYLRSGCITGQVLAGEAGNEVPVDATVIVVETEISTSTDPVDGTYCLQHRATEPGESLTLRVEVPGHQNAEVQFTLAGRETLVCNFALRPLGPPVISGDVDGDGSISITDVILLLRHLTGLTELTPSQFAAADVNEDGLLDIADATMIMRHLAGLEETLPYS